MKIDLIRNPEDPIGATFTVSEDNTIIDSISTQVSYEAVYKLLRKEIMTILDVGSGRGEHAKIFRYAGKQFTTLDPVFPADINIGFLDWKNSEKYDLVFCSHVLEHQRNIGAFIDKLISHTKDGGFICISVPPEISFYFLLCHPNQFSAGLLIYHLVMSGLDCSEAEVLTYGYNLSVIVRKKLNTLQKQSWAHEREAASFFPKNIIINDNQIFGPVANLNWDAYLGIKPHFLSGLEE